LSFLLLKILEFEILSSDVFALSKFDVSRFDDRNVQNHLIQSTFRNSLLSIFFGDELNKAKFHQGVIFFVLSDGGISNFTEL